MIKKLLSTSLLAALALGGANAYNVDDFAYTNNARYQILGANLVSNGKFNQGATGTDDWIATDGTAAPITSVFTMVEGAVNGSNSQKVLAGQTALNAGMYQLVPAEVVGTYLVTVRVMGTAAGYTDLDLTGGNTNYINAYYNTDGALATADDTNLLYGENGVNGGYGFSFGNEGFTEVSFAVEVPAPDGYIVIDFRGLAEGLEIADVECHLAQQVYDNRIAQRRLDYINTYLNAVSKFKDEEVLADLQAAIEEVKAGIEANASADEMEVSMMNLDEMWNEFAGVNFSNVIDVVPTKDGRNPDGNHSANWMKWTAKYNKLNSNYNGQAPWSWSSDRWCHKGTTEDSPMNAEWMRGAGTWTHDATLTTTLDKGVYFWGVSAEGGMATLNKNRWARSMAKECSNVALFFDGDTTEVFKLDPAVRKDYVFKFEVTEDEKEVALGIHHFMDNGPDGCFTSFYSPVLYKVLDEGLTPEEKAYINRFNVQLDALEGRLKVANDYLAEDQKELPWGKEALTEGLAEAQNRYDAWKAMTQEEILDAMHNFEELPDTVMEYGVRFLNNNYITPFVNMNKPLTDMPLAIAAAIATKEERIYSGSAMMQQLTDKIASAQAFYDAKLVVPFSSEDSLALITERENLENMVVDFKNAITETNLVDISFDGASVVKTEDPEGAFETYYTIAGKNGAMVTSTGEGTTAFELGYSNTDSLNILRVGNGEATVEVTGAPEATESDIVNVKFNYYFGNLLGKYAGFYLMSEEGDTITGLYISKYDGVAEYNPMSIDFNGKINGVGSGSASNAAIAASDNKTQFDIVLDYGAREIYCTTSGSKGTATTEKIAMTKPVKFSKFVLKSNYNNADRRCWFDNLVVNIIAAGETGVTEVAPAEEAAKAGVIYNVAGQQISAPAKGQIYIQNGAKYVK